MKLNRTGFLYRWTYLLSNKWDKPYQVSLCSFFWRCFVWMPLFWLLILSVVAAFLFLSWESKGLLPLAITTIFCLIVLGVKCHSKVVKYFPKVSERTGTVRGKIKQSFFWQGLKTIKGKMCPIIDCVDQED